MKAAASRLRVSLVSKREAAGLSGLARYAHSLYTALRQEGMDVTLEASPQVPFSDLLRKTGYDIGAFLANYPLWAPLNGHANLYHLASQNLATLLICRQFSRPVVVTVHDLIPYVLRNDPRLNNYRHIIDRVFDRWALWGVARADTIIAASEATKRDLMVHLGIPPSRIFVVPLGVDSDRFRPMPVPDAFHQRYGLGGGHRYILYVGSEAPHKNVAALLRAFALARERHPDIRLIKVGVPQFLRRRQRLLGLIDRLDLGEGVFFFDSVADEDLPLFYNIASVFVTPSLYEGFGLPALEAMACGTPVVCFTAASLPEVVDDAGILADKGDHRALAEGIVTLLGDDDLRQGLAQAGMRRAQTFTWQRTARETIHVYQRLGLQQ